MYGLVIKLKIINLRLRHLGMEESLFHRLMSEEATSTLRLQYRMNEALANVANRVAYNGKLKCANPTVAVAKLNIELQVLNYLRLFIYLL